MIQKPVKVQKNSTIVKHPKTKKGGCGCGKKKKTYRSFFRY
jgi:hypothetical protein